LFFFLKIFFILATFKFGLFVNGHWRLVTVLSLAGELFLLLIWQVARGGVPFLTLPL
jgi:hypothetical protein